MRDQFQELKYYSSLGDKGPEIDRLKEMLPFMAAELGEVENVIFHDYDGTPTASIFIFRHMFDRNLYIRYQKDAGGFVIADVQRFYAYDDMSGKPCEVTTDETIFSTDILLLKHLAELLVEEIFRSKMLARADELVTAAVTKGIVSSRDDNVSR